MTDTRSDTAREPEDRDMIDSADHNPDSTEHATDSRASDLGVAEPSNRDTDGGDAALTDD
ncbi:hypothetical protein ACFSC3_06715 [Sphingomonas floccifaciens]|uniref:Uncharacterized protein n=1 Tax=Sphingomonas floccifaciens TaxID=1844115 RepID=A0ABW4NBG4_9SPHN